MTSAFSWKNCQPFPCIIFPSFILYTIKLPINSYENTRDLFYLLLIPSLLIFFQLWNISFLSVLHLYSILSRFFFLVFIVQLMAFIVQLNIFSLNPHEPYNGVSLVILLWQKFIHQQVPEEELMGIIFPDVQLVPNLI